MSDEVDALRQRGPLRPMAPGRRILLGLGAAILALGGLSVRQALRAFDPVPFQGMKGVSAPWRAPAADSGRWVVSEGIAPPAASASVTELHAWLGAHYPVLALPARGAAPVSAGDRALELGGGPPRTLFVEPGSGLVMREP
ncbi:MAG: hypothetical protein IT376_00135 [Polyangiaceae bacterium]|nr:hypothetical protein [Polyangiaceae bacterium]